MRNPIRRPRRLHITDVLMGILGAVLLAAIVYGSFVSLTSGKYTPVEWASFIIFGLAQGSVYALIALGYTMVYGTLRMINFAHGEVFTSGAFTTYFFAVYLDAHGVLDKHPVLGLVAMVGLAALVSLAVAVLLERIAYRPLRDAPRLIPLITAIGASFFLQYSLRGLYGSGYKSYPEIEAYQGKWHLIGDLYILKSQAVVIVAAILLMIGLYLFVQRTKTGTAMRAVSENKAVAALMGVDVDRTIVITFAIGGAMAGAAGVLYAIIFRQVQAFMGFIPGLKAFTAAVLGGIGNIPGAMVGGLFLGIVESLGPPMFLEGLGVPSPHQLKDATAFTLLVLVLIFRPTGILGERLSDRA